MSDPKAQWTDSEAIDCFYLIVQHNLKRHPEGWTVVEETFVNERRTFEQRFFRDAIHGGPRASCREAAEYCKEQEAKP
jgi:hypothetical protein